MVSSVGVEQANDVVNQEKWKKDIEDEYDHPAEDKEEESGVPVLVNPVVLPNTEANTPLGVDMRVGSDNVSVVKTNQEKLAGDIKDMESVLG